MDGGDVGGVRRMAFILVGSFVCSHAGSVPPGTIRGNTKRVERGTILGENQRKGVAVNVQQWREMSGLIDRLVAVGAEDVVTTIETDGGNLRPYVSVRLWFGKADAVGEPYNDVYLEIGNEAPSERSHLVNCGHVTRRFDSAAGAVEWVEACHVAACFALLEAAGFERGPWGEWHKDGCLIQPHARYGEPTFRHLRAAPTVRLGAIGATRYEARRLDSLSNIHKP
jgi:hypothetical protein